MALELPASRMATPLGLVDSVGTAEQCTEEVWFLEFWPPGGPVRLEAARVSPQRPDSGPSSHPEAPPVRPRDGDEFAVSAPRSRRRGPPSDRGPERLRSNRRRRSRAFLERAARCVVEPLEESKLLATFVVENVSDSGAGSLRSAIIAANLIPGLDFIYFNIPGEGVHTIGPTSPLPAITDAIFINGDTQPGYAPGQPLNQAQRN